MTAKNTASEIHELTLAEINRQTLTLTTRRRAITEERAAIYAAQVKSGVSIDATPALDADERAAREQAKTLLNGSAPASLSLPPEISRDRILAREQRAIDIVLKVLGDKQTAARAATAVAWAEANSDRWRAVCRDITLAAVHLKALEAAARNLLSECVDIFAIRLPMGSIIGDRPVAEQPLDEVIQAALAEGIVTQPELRKASHVEQN